MQSIAFRLTLAFMCVILLLILQGVFAYSGFRNLEEVYRQSASHEHEMALLRADLAETRLRMYQFISTLNPATMDHHQAIIETHLQELDHQLTQPGIPAVLIKENAQLLRTVIHLHSNFYSKTARRLLNTRSEEIHQELFQQIQDHTETVARQNNALMDATRRKTLLITTGLLVAALVVSGVWALVLANTLTDRRRAEAAIRKNEERLRQAQKMESIGNLAGGIAHDFNNILASIIGYTELAIDDVEKGSPLQENLKEVLSAGKRARDLVKQILAFARQSNEERQPLQVVGIAEDALQLLRSTIPSNIEIKTHFDSQSVIVANPVQIDQMLINLCTNAAQAMEKHGGTLTISIRDTAVEGPAERDSTDLKAGEYVEIVVSDTGPGIAPDIMDSIFEPYFTTKGAGEGTGLGLAMVHGIVEEYGGKVALDNTVGQGATFRIYLPASRRRNAKERRSESESLPVGTERILLVDDETAIIGAGRQLLERLGYAVSIQTSSVKALERFRSDPQQFDLVISDTTMPIMTGDQLAAELLQIRPDIPIILCTGYSKKVSDEAAGTMGIKALLYKPVLKTDLAYTVRQVLDEAAT